MKALVLEKNASLHLRERPLPKPAMGEVLVQLKAVGICSSDLFRAFAGQARAYPLVMGHELAGIIAETKAAGFSVGQKVSVFPLLPCRQCLACQEKRWRNCANYDYFGSRRDGGLQEFLAVPSWNVMPLPPEIDLRLACLIEPISVASHVIDIVQNKIVSKALVLGAGFIGLVLALMLKDKFAPHVTVEITDRNSSKLSMARDLGFDIAPHSSTYNLIIEAVGAAETYQQSIRQASSQAEIIWMGNPKTDVNFSLQQVSNILRQELKISGSWNSSYLPQETQKDDDWQKAVRFIQKHAHIILPLISKTLSLEEASAFMEKLYEQKKLGLENNIIKSIVVFE